MNRAIRRCLGAALKMPIRGALSSAVSYLGVYGRFNGFSFLGLYSRCT